MLAQRKVSLQKSAYMPATFYYSSCTISIFALVAKDGIGEGLGSSRSHGKWEKPIICVDWLLGREAWLPQGTTSVLPKGVFIDCVEVAE